jgi:hypothetical protein
MSTPVMERDTLGPSTNIGPRRQQVVYRTDNVDSKFAASMVQHTTFHRIVPCSAPWFTRP